MARPSKPVEVLEQEKRSHRTKEELDYRRGQEAGLLTGTRMKEEPEVKADPAAHKEFTRARKLLGKIGRDDALYQNVINRYAKLKSEVGQLEALRKEVFRDGELQEIETIERLIQQKRKFLFDIEKENCMTVVTSLRSIPKHPPKEDEDDPFSRILG